MPNHVPESELFRNTSAGHVFHFTYEGEARLLKPYLGQRYRYWLKPGWIEHVYPHRVRLNHDTVTDETWARPGDLISYHHSRHDEPIRLEAPTVLHEDQWMVVIYKPDCVPVTPSGPYYFASLAIHNREVFANPELTPIHRLDLETDGPLVFAKRKAEIKHFHQLFQRRSIRKVYRALVHGWFPDDLSRIAGRIVPDPGSRITTKLRLEPDAACGHSVTSITRVVHHAAGADHRYSELELEPLTGKTNQIRIHLAHQGHAIVGDKKYHPDEGVFLDWIAHKDFSRLRDQLRLPRHALHCHSLTFDHPFTGETIHVEAPPGSWRGQIAALVDSALESALESATG